jgi:hypothetical protein
MTIYVTFFLDLGRTPTPLNRAGVHTKRKNSNVKLVQHQGRFGPPGYRLNDQTRTRYQLQITKQQTTGDEDRTYTKRLPQKENFLTKTSSAGVTITRIWRPLLVLNRQDGPGR